VLDAVDVEARVVAGKPGSEAAQLTPVGTEGVRRCSTFGGEDMEVCVDEVGDFGGRNFGGGW
jgi:hypothetical protein